MLTATSLNQGAHIEKSKRRIDSAKLWKQLQLDNSELESIARLIEWQVPPLTKSEVKVASLLIIGLSNDEIASKLNIRTASVEYSKNRMRRKLGLTKRSNLTLVFQKALVFKNVI